MSASNKTPPINQGLADKRERLTNAAPLSVSFDRVLSDLLRSDPSLWEPTEDGKSLVDLWLQSLRDANKEGARPPLGQGRVEVMGLFLERLGPQVWMQQPSGELRSRLHQLLDIWATGDGPQPDLQGTMCRLAEAVPGEAFVSWLPSQDPSHYIFLNALDLFALRMRDECATFWLKKRWPLPPLSPRQIGDADFCFFEYAVANGWDPFRSEGTKEKPAWKSVLDAVVSKTDYLNNAKHQGAAQDYRDYMEDLKGWLRTHNQGEALRTWEVEQYWKGLKKTQSSLARRRQLVSLEGWESLRTATGANPTMVALHHNPKLLLDDAWTRKAGSLLSENDSRGRDIWSYILSSPYANLDNPFGQSEVERLLLKYPPHNGGHSGWLGDLLLQSAAAMEAAYEGGSKLLPYIKESLFRHPELNPDVMVRLTKAEQEGVIQHVMVPANSSYSFVKNGLISLSRILSIQSSGSYEDLLPELRYLACLGALLGPKNGLNVGNIRSKSSWNGTTDDAWKEVASELSSLALGGLKFDRMAQSSLSKEPWLEGKSGWSSIMTVMKIEKRVLPESAKQDLETGWKNFMLASVPADFSSVTYDVPRL